LTEVVVRDEHDDDLNTTVDIRDDMETDDYPKTSEDFDTQDPEEHEKKPDEGDDVVGK
jgi:hypothetical protein